MKQVADPIRKRSSLKRKIALLSCLVGAISVAIFGAFTIWQNRQVAVRGLHEEAVRVSQIVRSEVAVALADGDYPEIVALGMRRMGGANETIRQILVASADGTFLRFRRGEWRRFANAGDAGITPRMEAPWWEVVYPGSTPVRHRETVLGDGGILGWVEVEMVPVDDRGHLMATYSMTGHVGGITFVIGGVLALVYARGLTRPMRELQAYAQKVAAGSLGERIQVDSDDEIADLADSINRMVQNLDASQRQLKDSLRSEAALREKEILLREIHHRVKNNMQILSSLLRLQTRLVNSSELRDVLTESEARIRSMGLLHERLYQSENVSSIDLGSYLSTLTTELQRMNRKPVRPEVHVSADSVHLELDTALPCGLIVTELVSNSLKYAFDEGCQKPEVVVEVTKTEAGEFSLVVWDNGAGIPSSVDVDRCESLGLRLVRMLTDQLNGSLTISAAAGTRVEVRFKESEYKNRY